MIDWFLKLLTHFYRSIFVRLNACVPLRELCSLLLDGATVDTYKGNQIAFRTVIQLDGDVFTMISRSDNTQALWVTHVAKVTNLLAHISNQLNGAIRMLTWQVGVAMFIILALCWRPDSALLMWRIDEWIHLVIINLLIPMGFGFLGRMPLLRRAIGKVFLRSIPIWLGFHGRRDRIEALQAAASEQR